MPKKLLFFLIIPPLFVSLTLLPFHVSGSYVFPQASETNFSKFINTVNVTAIRRHVEFLSSLDTRATGYAGNKIAAQYIYHMFKDYCGLENVTLQPFNVTDCVDHGANVTVSGHVIRVYPLLPNLVCPSTTPPEGITGRLIYAGEGYLEDFDGKEVKDSIVLIDWNTANRWINAARLGARALIFLPPAHVIPSSTGDVDVKYLTNTPLNFPRFYVDNLGAETLLDHVGEEARVVSTQTWEQPTTWNVMGFVKGESYPNKYLLLSSYYDSRSVAPSIAPGAQEACGVSALIEIAKYLHENPPKYSVMFVAFGGHHQALAGSVEFYNDYFSTYAHVDNDPLKPYRDPSHAFALNILAHLNLDLSTGTNAVYFTTVPGLYGVPAWTLQSDWEPLGDHFKQIYNKINEQKPEGKTYEAMFLSSFYFGSLATRTIHPQVLSWKQFSYDHEPAVCMHTGGWTFTTAYDPRPYFTTPFDTIDKVNFSNLKTQLELVHALILTFLNEDEKVVLPLVQTFLNSKAKGEVWGNWYWLKGRVVAWSMEKAWYVGVPNALVYMELRLMGMSGYDIETPYRWCRLFTFADEEGNLTVKWGMPHYYYYYISAWVVNSTTGNVIYAPDHGQHIYAPPTVWNPITDYTPLRPYWDIGYVTAFRASTMVLFDTVLSTSLSLPQVAETGTWIYPSISIYKFALHNVPVSWSYWEGEMVPSIVVLAFPPDLPIEVVWKFPIERYPTGYLVNASSEHPNGLGYTLKAGEQLTLPITTLGYAENLYWLNEERFKIVKMYRPDVINVEGYQQHLQAKSLIEEAHHALDRLEYSRAYAYAFQAFSSSLNAYLYVRPWIESAAFTIPFLAFFLLPFAFLAEKLLFGWSSFRRIISFLCVFAFFLIAFYFLHPGFMLASSPIMIIIGFSTLILSAPLLIIISRHSQAFIKQIRISRIGKHEAEISRVSEVGHAFLTGVEHMKKVKLRSALTLVSIILMVAAVCNLTSISPVRVVQAMPWAGAPQYNGVYIHRFRWGWGYYQLSDELLEFLKAKYGDQATIIPRAWKYMPMPYATIVNPGQLMGFRTTYNGKTIITPVMWGLTPMEKDPLEFLFLNCGRWFEPYDRSTVILNVDQAEKLGINSTDIELGRPVDVTVEGIPCRVIGIVNMDLQYFSDIDGEGVTPVILDWTPPPNPWTVHVDLSYCIIMHYEDVIALGGYTASISLKFDNQSLVDPAARDIFNMLSCYQVFSCVGAGTSSPQMFLRTGGLTVMVWGLENEAIPFAIVMLAIFNIVLGSVYERRREIATYGTVGLSPLHIAFMFLAETIVYALLGGIVGYMFALLQGKMMEAFIPGVPVNYSSSLVLTAVGAAMAAILTASIYPIWVASRLVTPSLERVWKIPTKPFGNVWEIPLPFIAVGEETGGIITYLKEFVEPHLIKDAPDFSASDIIVTEGEREGQPYIQLSMDTRLFPYELGITQTTDIYLFQSKPDRWESRVVLTKTQGGLEVWMRLSRHFIDLLRKQLLLWRTMSPDEKSRYVKLHKERASPQ